MNRRRISIRAGRRVGHGSLKFHAILTPDATTQSRDLRAHSFPERNILFVADPTMLHVPVADISPAELDRGILGHATRDPRASQVAPCSTSTGRLNPMVARHILA